MQYFHHGLERATVVQEPAEVAAATYSREMYPEDLVLVSLACPYTLPTL